MKAWLVALALIAWVAHARADSAQLLRGLDTDDRAQLAAAIATLASGSSRTIRS